MVADDAGGQEPQLQHDGVRVLVARSDEAAARQILAAADDTGEPDTALRTSGPRVSDAQVRVPRECLGLPCSIWYTRKVVTASTIVPTDSTTSVIGTGR